MFWLYRYAAWVMSTPAIPIPDIPAIPAMAGCRQPANRLSWALGSMV